jgi:hypothetical protein
MAEYVPERGYWTGPTLDAGERPWPLLWEQGDVIDTCRHEWERIVISDSHPEPMEPAVRCRICHTPRCGHSDDHDPCMERRHHRGIHIRLSGQFDPVGGYLS